MIRVPLCPHEMKVMYNINNGPPIEFWVPGLNQNMRWAAYSVGLPMSSTHVQGTKHPTFPSDRPLAV